MNIASFIIALSLFNSVHSIDWKTDTKIFDSDVLIKSDRVLGRNKIIKIKRMMRKIEYTFLHQFEPGLECIELDKLEIRIIDKKILRSKKYFSAARPSNFGRYFPTSNTLYIIHEFFDNPEWLAHEMAHYYYDECDVHFSSIDEEHKKVYAFQDIFKNWIMK